MENFEEIKKLLDFSIINLDKSRGPTSFTVSDFVRRKLSKYGIKKTSHFGTLDPAVTGVLPIAIGRACKLTGFFIGHDKEYFGVMHTREECESEDLQKIIDKDFVGKITQLPPRKSSVKRAEREREIKEFKILESSLNKKDFLFRARVQGGTYIRKLIHDLGEMIGGAHMAELRRSEAGIFKESDKEFVNLYEFEDAIKDCEKGDVEKLKKILIPAEEAIKKILRVLYLDINEERLKQLLTGKKLIRSDFGKDIDELDEGEVFAVFYKDRFVEIAEKILDEKNEGNDKIVARSKFVYN